MISTLVGIKRITFLIFTFFSFFKPCSYFQQLIMPKRSSAWSANARLHREMNTLVRWNSFPIVLRSGFTFRRVIRSAGYPHSLCSRKGEERNRKTLPLHSSNSRHNYCCHSLLRTVGWRIAEIVPRMLRCRHSHTACIYREPGRGCGV